jgi:hypothetical protein
VGKKHFYEALILVFLFFRSYLMKKMPTRLILKMPSRRFQIEDYNSWKKNGTKSWKKLLNSITNIRGLKVF